ncbi:hypothetical protein MIND_00149800 [Mycena indigotica]|uniref:Tc1-like transposase DDE domain-containing protein n=1 Tax=Mycena indigotica TaxID=2126181 RepID=A0A8H6TFB2_9AGAR|nr:uncharacterized protein MIND_00149800 [Mycena indigotica]KAF7316311.1 hypothetical protein MIND_00149800 [Mycena indigotica]
MPPPKAHIRARTANLPSAPRTPKKKRTHSVLTPQTRSRHSKKTRVKRVEHVENDENIEDAYLDTSSPLKPLGDDPFLVTGQPAPITFQCEGFTSRPPTGAPETFMFTTELFEDVDEELNSEDEDLAFVNPEFDELLTCAPGTFPYDGYPRPAPPLEYLARMKAAERQRVVFSAPSVTAAHDALVDLMLLMKGEIRGPNSKGYKKPKFDTYVRARLEGMRTLLSIYTSPRSTTYEDWGESAMQAAIAVGRGKNCARVFAELARAFIEDRQVLPCNPYGKSSKPILNNESLDAEVRAALRGQEITAEKTQAFVNREDIRERYKITSAISIRTARRYLIKLGFAYGYAKKGQYSDGHEREDVVVYREETYLPTLKDFEERSYIYHADGTIQVPRLPPGVRPTCIWYHDESIFYGHDRRRKLWQDVTAGAKPYQKGEGGSFMAADYFSADFGWLRGAGGAADIEEQARAACAIATTRWPEFDHIFIYDNATTHRARTAGALTAMGMPKFTSGSRAIEAEEEGRDGGEKTKKPRAPKKTKPAGGGNETRKKKPPKKTKPPKDPKDANFLVQVNKLNEDQTIMHDEHGERVKEEIQMTGATFADGSPQSLYFPTDVEKFAGKFKGMAVILEERRLRGDLGEHLTKEELAGKVAQCKKFKCPKVDAGRQTTCCMRRMLFDQPDFANVQSCLEAACSPFNVTILFLPKFHPELNPIEMVWGFAKRMYRQYPESSGDEALERNTLTALDSVPLASMRRFVLRAHRFADAYRKGLDGAQAAWAVKKYKGHRMLPPEFRAELEKAEAEAKGTQNIK